eukprot:gene543-8055_t
MDVWDDDLNNEEYEQKMRDLENESIQRKYESIGFNEGMEQVNVENERQKGFEDGFIIGTKQNYTFGQIFGELQAIKEISKNKFDRLTIIEENLKKLNLRDALILKYLEDFVEKQQVVKEIEFLEEYLEIKSSILKEI